MHTAIRRSVRLAAGFGLMALLAACDDSMQDRAAQDGQGSLVIEDAYILDNPGPAPTAAAYLTIRNTGQTADALVGVSTPDAGMASLHMMEHGDGMARMRHSDKMEIPPGESLTLAPGNRHIMLMQVKRVLAPGDIVPMTLQFESAPAQAVDFPVRALGDEGAS